MADITKADFYEAAEKFFPEHNIVFEKSITGNRRFTDCMVGETCVMRFCPRLDVYGLEPHIILFTKEGNMDIDLPEDLPIIIGNSIERGIV